MTTATLHPQASPGSHVRAPEARSIITSRNWVALENAALHHEATTLCGAAATDRDLVLPDLIRAGKLIRGGQDLDAWVGCADCRRLTRERAAA